METEKNTNTAIFHIPKENKKALNKGIWKRFFKLMYKAKLPYGWILLCLVSGLVCRKVGLLFPSLTGKIFSGDFSSKVIIGFVAVSIFNQVYGGVGQFINNTTIARIGYKMRLLLWKILMKLPVGYYDKYKAREMISRTTSDTDNLSQFIVQIVIQFTLDVYTFVQTVLIIRRYDYRLAASMFIFVPLVIFSAFILGRLNFYANSKVTLNLSKLNQFLGELINNIPLVKSFANEKKEECRGKNAINKLYTVSVKKGSLTVASGLVQSLLSACQTLIIVILGIIFITGKKLGVGTWVAYYLYATNLVTLINSQMGNWTAIKAAQGSTERISNIVEEPLEYYNQSRTLEEVKEDIHFKDVSFMYNDKKVLSDISFDIPFGKTTVIVGPSGGGKTTIANLLIRFYKPVSGDITIGDTSIDEYDLKEWRKSFGYVSQDAPMVSGTVKENILYGVEREVSEEEFRKAADMADVTGFVNKFAEGFEKEVGEFGSKLSGGQKQRIAIARAILMNPKFLLFDEATSNLDAYSEYEVQKGLDYLMKDRTTIIIAHKLAAAASADNIIVIDSGTVSGIGTHDELFKTNKLYKQLVDIQKGDR